MTHFRIHFIAIGGAAMHNLALVLKKQGHLVTGSDDEIYEPSRTRLANVGILPAEMGWFPNIITSDIDAIILGMHARIDNPELQKAQELGLKIYSYPEYIFEQSRHKQRIVIAGSHGKTSITSIILHVLNCHQRKFDYLVGAGIEGFENGVGLSEDAPIIIIEGDEYLASALQPKSKFLFYQPHLALVSGVAWDHFNKFPTFESYIDTFGELVENLPKAGRFIYDETDNVLRIFGEEVLPDVVKVPYEAHPYRIENGKAILDTPQGDVPLLIFGEHNMKNLHGAKHVLDALGITDEQFYEAIPSFKGASKRLEKLGENQHCLVYRDFAHAPSKLCATTEATKELYPNRKLVAVYELHTYSSLNQDFLPQYAAKMDAADVAIVFYSAKTLEIKQMPVIEFDFIRESFGRDDIQVFTDKESLEAFLLEQHYYDANLLLMSSGTFGGLDVMALTKKVVNM